MPLGPANDGGGTRPLSVGGDDAGRARPAAVLRAGRRPGHRQGRGRGHYPGGQRPPPGPPPARNPNLPRDQGRAAVAGGLAALLRDSLITPMTSKTPVTW